MILVALCAPALLAQQHSYTPADIEAGARLYAAHCAVCHGLDGDLVHGVNLRQGRFRRASSDDDLARLIGRGVPGTAMPPTNLLPGQLFGLVAYLRSMREFGGASALRGDRTRGQALFEGKGNCVSCHRVNGKGARTGPDLSEVGLIRPPADLERSIVRPDAVLHPQHRFVRAVTRDGVEITGRRLNEDTHTVQLLDRTERLVSLEKASLREYETIKTSPMPSFADKLSGNEIADIVSYLASLRGSDTQ
jgi:putative heme-binding domain-containing protein